MLTFEEAILYLDRIDFATVCIRGFLFVVNKRGYMRDIIYYDKSESERGVIDFAKGLMKKEVFFNSDKCKHKFKKLGKDFHRYATITGANFRGRLNVNYKYIKNYLTYLH